jgi:8-oxo-dGTP pyrophosphatase MutT (NUDIX family)
VDGVRDAATVVLVRDGTGAGEGGRQSERRGSGLEVFVLQRHPAMVFGGGAHVFPGGAVDPGDRAPEVSAHVVGLDDATASDRLGLRAGGLGFWVAAVREAFEEANILLLRDRTGGFADPGAHAGLRADLNGGTATSRDLFAATGAALHAGDLHVLAHFVTPPGAPRRYDTWFFVAAVPEGQEGVHDDDEAVHSEWLGPGELLRRASAGDVHLFGPTPQVVRLLDRFDCARDLLAAAGAAQRASDGRAGVTRDGWGERVVLPGEPGYGVTRRTWTQPLPTPARPRRYDASDTAPAEGVA